MLLVIAVLCISTVTCAMHNISWLWMGFQYDLCFIGTVCNCLRDTARYRGAEILAWRLKELVYSKHSNGWCQQCKCSHCKLQKKSTNSTVQCSTDYWVL